MATSLCSETTAQYELRYLNYPRSSAAQSKVVHNTKYEQEQHNLLHGFLLHSVIFPRYSSVKKLINLPEMLQRASNRASCVHPSKESASHHLPRFVSFSLRLCLWDNTQPRLIYPRQWQRAVGPNYLRGIF